MPYNFISDPSHGWLRVKTKELRELGILDKISHYSYASPTGKSVYLEEDGDVTVFLKAKGIELLSALPQIRYISSDKPSIIRTYEPFYNPDAVSIEQLKIEIERLQAKLDSAIASQEQQVMVITEAAVNLNADTDEMIVNEDEIEESVTDDEFDAQLQELKEAFSA
jgi:hypothetical protein